MNFKEKLKDNIPKFYAVSFLKECIFIIPVIVLFWQENGLNLAQIMLLQSLFAISIVFLEVPTGVIADKWGRKNSMIIGAILLFISSVTYSLGHNFLDFLTAEIMWGAGVCFFSGADSAFVYETLKQTKKEKDFKKIFGNANSWGYFAAAITGIIGGFIAIYNIRANWYIESLFMFLIILVVINFKEPKHERKLEEKNYWKHTLNCFKEAIRNKNILFLVLFSGILVTLLKIVLWFYQSYMKAAGLGVAYFGIFWATFAVFTIAGSKYAHKIEKRLGEKNSLWLIIILSTFGIVFMGMTTAFFGIFFIYFQQFVRGFNNPIIEDYTNKHLTSDKRATLLSIQSLVGNLFFAIISPIFGWLADNSSLNNSITILGFTFFLFFLALMIWKRSSNT